MTFSIDFSRKMVSIETLPGCMKLVFGRYMDKTVEKCQYYYQFMFHYRVSRFRQQRETGNLLLSKSSFGRNLILEF